MTKFTYDDIVKVIAGDSKKLGTGERAWIVGVFEVHPDGRHFDQFLSGVVHSIEFGDGSSLEVHESDLELDE